MQSLFCFDGPVYQDIHGVYCHTTLTNDVLKRYLTGVNKLVIFIRIYEIKMSYVEAGLTPIDDSRIEFVKCENINSVKGSFVYRKKVKKLVEQFVCNSDYIYLRIPSNISNIAADAARKYGKKYMAEVGGCAFDSYWNHSLMGKIVAIPLLFHEKISVYHADLALYVTNSFLQKRYPCINKTYACSDVVLQDLKVENLYKRLQGIRDIKKKYTLGTLAAIDVKYKGQQFVIKAISILNRLGYDFSYQLVGTGKSDYLKKVADKYGVSDKIYFLGAKPHKDVFAWLDSIDIYIQPSLQEGLPRALIEAMSRGCPSLGTDLAGIPELLDKNYLFRGRSVRGIVEKLVSIVDCLEENAIKNFYKAEEFEAEKLEKRRNDIFKEFVQENKN